MSTSSNHSARSDQELHLINSEIARLIDEMQQMCNQFPSVPSELNDEEKGEFLLNAFLKDEPFDRFAFAYQPIKISFLNAAFRTCDPEIVTYALNQVKNTLDRQAFNNILDVSPQFRGAFNYLSNLNNNSKIISIDANLPKEQVIDNLNNARKNSNDLMKLVIDDEIKRLSGNPIAGRVEVDLKWERIGRSVNQPNLITPESLTTGGFFKFFNKWSKVVDPKQAALVMRSLKYPEDIVYQCAKLVKDPKDKAELDSYGIHV